MFLISISQQAVLFLLHGHMNGIGSCVILIIFLPKCYHNIFMCGCVHVRDKRDMLVVFMYGIDDLHVITRRSNRRLTTSNYFYILGRS